MSNASSSFFAACAAALAAFKARRLGPSVSDAASASPPDWPLAPEHHLAPEEFASPQPLGDPLPSNPHDPGTSPRLAARLAHEFNNYLTVIDGYSRMLLADPPEDSGALRALDEIQKASKKATLLTRQMLAYAGRQPLRPSCVDPLATLQAMRLWLEQLAGFSIQLVLPAGPAMPQRVVCDPAALEQIITLLATQSIARMQVAGGVLSFELVFDADAMHLTIRDTAEPLPAEVRSHLFEPFYSTVPRGKGAGMALAAAQGFAVQSGGSLSTAGTLQGNAFVLTLPLQSSVGSSLYDEIETASPSMPVPPLSASHAPSALFAPIPPAGPAFAPPTSPRPRPDLSALKILLAEDEQSLRRLIMQMLERRGAKPLEAEDGESALALARSAPPLDLLLTDISMPGMDGFELYERLRATTPALRVIFMSGYTRDVIEDETPLHPDIGFLTKPFSPKLLYQAICAAIPTVK